MKIFTYILTFLMLVNMMGALKISNQAETQVQSQLESQTETGTEVEGKRMTRSCRSKARTYQVHRRRLNNLYRQKQRLIKRIQYQKRVFNRARRAPCQSKLQLEPNNDEEVLQSIDDLDEEDIDDEDIDDEDIDEEDIDEDDIDEEDIDEEDTDEEDTDEVVPEAVDTKKVVDGQDTTVS